jgi:hypothetical protein
MADHALKHYKLLTSSHVQDDYTFIGYVFLATKTKDSESYLWIGVDVQYTTPTRLPRVTYHFALDPIDLKLETSSQDGGCRVDWPQDHLRIESKEWMEFSILLLKDALLIARVEHTRRLRGRKREESACSMMLDATFAGFAVFTTICVPCRFPVWSTS